VVTGCLSAVRDVYRIVRVYISWFCCLRSLVCNVDDHEVKRPKFQIFLASLSDSVAVRPFRTLFPLVEIFFQRFKRARLMCK